MTERVAAPRTMPAPIREAASLAARFADRHEQEGTLAPEVVEALVAAGFARHFVPAAYGGRAGTFTDMLHAVEAVAESCTSAGWCASLTASAGRMAAYLPREGRDDVWGNGPDALLVGGLIPVGRARPEPGGWRVHGRWPNISAVEYSDWALVCAVTPTSGADGERPAEARFFAVPRAAYRIEKTWDGVGMSGTGSHTLVLEEITVPAHRAFARDDLMAGVRSSSEEVAPCHRVPVKAVNGLGFAAPALGAITAALDTGWTQAWERGRPTVGAEAPASLVGLSRAAGEADAARLLLERVAATADRGTPTAAETARAGRDSAVAADLLVSAAGRVMRAGGTRAQARANRIQRSWRDINTLASHTMLRFETAVADYARVAGRPS